VKVGSPSGGPTFACPGVPSSAAGISLVVRELSTAAASDGLSTGRPAGHGEMSVLTTNVGAQEVDCDQDTDE
jgi:hypothetical protein